MKSRFAICTVLMLALLAGCTLAAGRAGDSGAPAGQPSARPPGEKSPGPPSQPGPATPADAPIADEWNVRLFADGAGWAQAGQKIWHTADGGRTWREVTPKTAPLQRVQFVDGKGVWIFTPQVLMRTKDGGQTWLTVKAPFVQASLAFADDRHGWALVSDGVALGSMPVELYATRDGGDTWSRISRSAPDAPDSAALPLGGLKNAIAFRDARTGWVTGESYATGTPWSYVTRDGGATWRQLELPVPKVYEPAMFSVQAPLLPGTRDIILPARVLGPRVETIFFTSADGGETWTVSPALPGGGPYAFADARHGWYSDGQGLRATEDGGRTWGELATEPTLRIVQALTFPNAREGLAVAAGVLRRTEDGGRTWMPVSLP